MANNNKLNTCEPGADRLQAMSAVSREISEESARKKAYGCVWTCIRSYCELIVVFIPLPLTCRRLTIDFSAFFIQLEALKAQAPRETEEPDEYENGSILAERFQGGAQTFVHGNVVQETGDTQHIVDLRRRVAQF